MRIMGIDPGSLRAGFGIIDFFNGSPQYITSGVIKTNQREEIGKRLFYIYNEILKIINKFKPEVLILEKIFHSKNVDSTLKLGEVRGVLLLVAEKEGIQIFEYSSKEVKKSVSGYGGSHKEQVKKMVQVILGINDNISEDESDALAIAICHGHHILF